MILQIRDTDVIILSQSKRGYHNTTATSRVHSMVHTDIVRDSFNNIHDIYIRGERVDDLGLLRCYTVSEVLFIIREIKKWCDVNEEYLLIVHKGRVNLSGQYTLPVLE